MTSFFDFSCYKKSRGNGSTYCNKIRTHNCIVARFAKSSSSMVRWATA
nr:MAG TPA: hypothetical protein [Caudoviricetes sp.]DAU45763.1 MAG TPA: hypothetical protein [Caudoviricetes sp.]DAX15294.1 MAG TPA: hypothetical protein [Caudoviricetes sp.]